tara:strand:- start:42 stop:1334 length:1293 start_codon:yes stop_codon:yes gene_type:complete
MAKTGRNQPCPCGKTGPDGRRLKYKRCCGAIKAAPSPTGADLRDALIRQHLARYKADELIRTQQQGRGKPIIALKTEHHQLIAVKDRLHWGKWRTFADFLQDYIKKVLDPEWGNAEIAKALEERHPTMQWYDAYCHFQRKHGFGQGEVKSAPITGVVACYILLAYNLYLISHNVELQERLIARLKDRSNFQGAYYELMVASVLIRAGFDLTLEDETSRHSKHCEFSAVSKTTGKKFWIEAKMKGLSGLLGKTDADGSKDPNPTSHLVTHLAGAMSKPAADDRMIFVDLNAALPAEYSFENPPAFVEDSKKRMLRYAATNMPEGEKAYVFITCTSFHRDLENNARLVAFSYGLGIPDFNVDAPMRVSERYRKDQRHPDAIAVGKSLIDYLVIPTTFDGGLPSDEHGANKSRVLIGSTYAFGEGDDAVVGTV